jgi:hypothetical protein
MFGQECRCETVSQSKIAVPPWVIACSHTIERRRIETSAHPDRFVCGELELRVVKRSRCTYSYFSNVGGQARTKPDRAAQSKGRLAKLWRVLPHAKWTPSPYIVAEALSAGRDVVT